MQCRRCPRLVRWREQVAERKRASFADQSYWGRPVPGFGDASASLLIVGLAPAAHGANRTGRMFTGDRSGDWLYRALHKAGLASNSRSVDRADGLRLANAFITAVVRCAPPENKPTAEERENCRPWLEAELNVLSPRAVLCLGGVAFAQMLRVLSRNGISVPSPRPKFGHGVEVDLRPQGPFLIGSYHPSQQNTFTGRLTTNMLDAVVERAAAEMVR